MPLNFVILYGSVRPERQGIRVARFIDGQIRGRGHSTTLIDPMIYRLPLLERMYKEYKGAAPAPLEELAGLYRKADGFVIVSGEYNHGIPPALKNLLDHFLEEYFWRPSAIVCYSAGMFGGVRAAMQLRATLSELGMPSIPSLLPFGRVGTTFTEDGVLQDPSAFASATARFLSELEWYARAFQAERAKGTPYLPIPTKAPVCNGIMPPGDSGIMAPPFYEMIPPGRRVR